MTEPDSFNIFWQEYPRKVAKIVALKAWNKLNPDSALVAKILKAVKKHKTSVEWTKDNGQFIPYPGTYLNQQRWEDVLTYGHDGKLAEDIKVIEETIARKKEYINCLDEGDKRYLELQVDINYWSQELERLMNE